MKTEWKLTFAAQFGLALIMTLTVVFIGSAFLFVVPMVVKIHHDLDRTLPGYLLVTVNASRLVFDTLWIWLTALAAGIVLFEWKCRSENKALIRTTVGVGASLVLILLAFWVAATIVIPVVQLQRTGARDKAEPAVSTRTADARPRRESNGKRLRRRESGAGIARNRIANVEV